MSCASIGGDLAMLKRACDLLVAATGLVVAAPLLALVALAVRLDSPGPIFYRAARIGLAGRTFTMLKFRTMVADAQARGPRITTRDDPRVTRVGRLLRRTRLDELPQLVNVLRGEMSLVGPRPEAPRFVALYPPEARAILTVRPGITGLAQLVFRNEARFLVGEDAEAAYIRRVLPAKIRIDLAYVAHASLVFDAWLIVLTIVAMSGADELADRLVAATLRRVGSVEAVVGA
jgi:lipopolysaccharide/colanic/teichoic acid biosynthesis glycosyltransferase